MKTNIPEELLTVKIPRYFPALEVINILFFVATIFIAYKADLFPAFIAPVLIVLFAYVLLTMVFYFTLSPKVVFKKEEVSHQLTKHDITRSERENHAAKASLFINLVKTMLVILFFFILLFGEIVNTPFLILPSVAAFIFAMLFLSWGYTKSLVYANGYINADPKVIFKRFMIYHAPEDSRSMVDKPFGFGTQINFGSKHGRFLIYFLGGFFTFIVALMITVILIAK